MNRPFFTKQRMKQKSNCQHSHLNQTLTVDYRQATTDDSEAYQLAMFIRAGQLKREKCVL